MVTLSKVSIKNFKFYIDDTIEINKKGFLVYGENGVGKSSFFNALYYLLYGYFDNGVLENLEEHQNRTKQGDTELVLELSNGESIEIKNGTLIDDTSVIDKQNIYMLDYRFLESFADSKDFFKTLKESQIRFGIFDDIFKDINTIKSQLDIDETEIVESRIELDEKITKQLVNIQSHTNDIIKELKENFKVTLELIGSQFIIGETKNTFIEPKIYIKIDGVDNYTSHFNESKIKILSLALVFSIIELTKEQIEKNTKESLKLLVLDDFLSSLDMGNRLYIMEYIFNHFEEYQKIILTHNALFFNIIKRLIHVHNKHNMWEYKNIYQSLRSDGVYEPKILAERDYLKNAKEAFDDLDYEQCGHLLRKEIERIMAQATFLFRTGKKESLEDAITHIRQRNRYYINSNKVLEDMNLYYEKFKTKQFENDNISVNRKLEIMMKKLDQCFEDINIDSDRLNQILENINFYQTITNQASHYESGIDYHKIEYQEALQDVKKLKDIFEDFNKNQNKG